LKKNWTSPCLTSSGTGAMPQIGEGSRKYREEVLQTSKSEETKGLPDRKVRQLKHANLELTFPGETHKKFDY